MLLGAQQEQACLHDLSGGLLLRRQCANYVSCSDGLVRMVCEGKREDAFMVKTLEKGTSTSICICTPGKYRLTLQYRECARVV